MKRLIASALLLGSSLAFAAQPFTVVLDWFVNPDHAPIFVAKQQGYFKQAGLNVHIIAPADGSDGPKMVAAGKADLAISYQPTLMYQVTHGLPLVRVGTLIDQPLSCLVTRADSGFTSIKQLRSKLIGYSSDGGHFTTLKVMLAHNGLNLHDVKLVNVHYDLVQALLAKRVAAFQGGMRNYEPLQMALHGVKAKLFLPENNGVPSYDELIFEANGSHMNTAQVKAFLYAVQRGVAYLRAHPNLTWQRFAKNHPSLNNALNHKAWLATIKYFARYPMQLDKQRYQRYAKFMFKQGEIPYLPHLQDYAVQLR